MAPDPGLEEEEKKEEGMDVQLPFERPVPKPLELGELNRYWLRSQGPGPISEYIAKKRALGKLEYD